MKLAYTLIPYNLLNSEDIFYLARDIAQEISDVIARVNGANVLLLRSVE